MKLSSSIGSSSILTYLADAASALARFGWAPGNIASLSQILTNTDLEPFFMDEFNPKQYNLKHAYPNLKNLFIMVTSDDMQARTLGSWRWKIHRSVGIIRINPNGKSYQLVWGLGTSSVLTRRVEEHLAIHNAAIKRDPNHRVAIWASPSYCQEHSYYINNDEAIYSYNLWTGYPDLSRLAPQGMGIIESTDLDPTTWTQLGQKFSKYNAVVLKGQGLFVGETSWDKAVGLINAIDRSAQLLLLFGSDTKKISPDFFQNYVKPYKLTLNSEALNYGKIRMENSKTDEKN